MGILIMPATLIADQMRVYCTDGGVITEHRPLGNYTEENKLYQYSSFLVERSEMPQYEYYEQLRCNGNSLIVDNNFKPEWVLKQDQLNQARKVLDAELNKAEPDILTVLRLQRTVEQIKDGGK
jgi:hypothetical protein